jgi:hypothetical protein
MYKNSIFCLAYLLREILRETKNGSFAFNATRAVFLLLFHESEIGCRGEILANIGVEVGDPNEIITSIAHYVIP